MYTSVAAMILADYLNFTLNGKECSIMDDMHSLLGFSAASAAAAVAEFPVGRQL
jgi:hypothetical protein